MKKSWIKLTSLLLIASFVIFVTDVSGRGTSSGSRSFSSGSRSFSSGSKSSSSSSVKSTPAPAPKVSAPAPAPKAAAPAPAPAATAAPASKDWGGKSTASVGSRSDNVVKAAPAVVPSSPDPAPAKVAPKSSSATTVALANSSKITGKTTQTAAVSKYKSEKESMAAMKSDPSISSKYKTDFKEAPASRPDYVPSYYTPSGGTRVEVVYRNGYGYGYYNNGAWLMYDPLVDVAMYSYLASHHHNYAYSTHGDGVVYVSGSRTPFIIFGSILIFAIVLMVLVSYNNGRN